MSNPYRSPQPPQEPGHWTAAVLPWVCLAGTALACVVAWTALETSNLEENLVTVRQEPPPPIDRFRLQIAAWSGLLGLLPATAYFILARKTWLVALVLLVVLVVGMGNGLVSLWFLLTMVET